MSRTGGKDRKTKVNPRAGLAAMRAPPLILSYSGGFFVPARFTPNAGCISTNRSRISLGPSSIYPASNDW